MNRFLIIVALLLFPAVRCAGQYHERFDSERPTWKRSETDCVIRSHKWVQRRLQEPDDQNRFERVEVENGPGRHLFIAHDVPPSQVIPELVPSIRIRSPRAGAQLYARVVLPNTPSPQGKGPMTALLRGPIYRHADRWETLSFDQLKNTLDEILQEETWVLRNKYGQSVNRVGAYIDKIAVNAYSGEGRTEIDLDDLKLDGRVTATEAASRNPVVDPNFQPSAYQLDEETGKAKSLVTLDGSLLLVNGQPFFPRIIQYRGEPLNFLKALGFNVIELSRTATAEQLRQAQQLDLWLICPPPSTAGLEPIDFKFDRVLAWMMGQQLGASDLPIVEQRIREVRESDSRYGRPVLGHGQGDWKRLGALVDIVAAGLEPIGTSFIASQYSDWLTARRQAIGNQMPLWADVQTEFSAGLVSQIESLVPALPPIPIEPQQVKFLAWEAIAGGCRGMRFRSRQRLDGVDPVSRLRALTLQWINAQLDQLEPWIVGGALMGPLPLDQHPEAANLTVTAIDTSRSRLLLVQRPTHHEQYLAGDRPPGPLTFRDVSSPYTDHAYQLGQSGLNTLANVRNVTGTQIALDRCPYTAAVVLTQDPLVVNRLTRSYERIAQQSILSMHLDLTRHWLAIEQLIEQQLNRMGRLSETVGGLLADAGAALGTAREMADRGNQSIAERYLHQADHRLAAARREWMIEPIGMFQSKTSAPLTVHASLIPFHWELAGRLAEGQWNPNGLAGGDFENLPRLLSTGWQNRSRTIDGIVSNVELATAAAVDGQRGLKMTVTRQPGPSPPPLLPSPPLQIGSPPVSVRAGQLVRIHGWINVSQVVAGSLEGLRITDSLGGPDMAERIPVTRGWQEFSLYRVARDNGQVSVQFEMTGLGTALIDEVTIRTIELPLDRQARR